MKLFRIIFLLVICHVSFAQSKLESDLLVVNESITLNGVTYTELNSGGDTNTSSSTLGGQVYLENFGVEGDDFDVRLQAAIGSLPTAGGIINCRGVIGAQSMSAPVDIDKPAHILLGQMVLTMDNADGENMFNIQSSGVGIIGLGRSVNSKDKVGKTQLIMANSAGDELQGYHFYNRGFSCITIKDMDLYGKRSELGEQYNTDADPLSGAGGIYMEKPTPFTTSSYNTVSQILIDNVYIEDTKAHGIYLHSPMLSTISNVRISGAGGHGIFINEGTSCSLNSVYVSGAHFAGVCMWGHSYASVINSASEGSGIGWWIRSCNNITLISPGLEVPEDRGESPWGEDPDVYGLNLWTKDGTGTLQYIKDVNSTYAKAFRGSGFLISGGDGIQILSPYCKDIAQGVDVPGEARYFKVTDGNTKSRLISPTIKGDDNLGNRFDIEVAADVKGFRLEWNPRDDGTVTNGSVGYVTDDAAAYAPVFLGTVDGVTTSYIKSGNEEFDVTD